MTIFQIAGYGTSPDDRVTIGQLEQRVSLTSYKLVLDISNHLTTII
jgi:hypothetical protein